MNFDTLKQQYSEAQLEAKIQLHVGYVVDMIATFDLDVRDCVVDELSFLLRDDEQEKLSEVYHERDLAALLSAFATAIASIKGEDKPSRFIHRDGLFPDGFYLEYHDGACEEVYIGSREPSYFSLRELEETVASGFYREITDEPGDPFDNYGAYVPGPPQFRRPAKKLKKPAKKKVKK